MTNNDSRSAFGRPAYRTIPLAIVAVGMVALSSITSVRAQTTANNFDNYEISRDDNSLNQSPMFENVEVVQLNSVDVPANMEGLLLQLNVREGDRVKEGQLIATCDSRSAELAVELKKAEEKEMMLQAQDNVNLRAAENDSKLADKIAESFISLYEQRATSKYEMEQKRLEAIKQRLRIELAKMEQEVKKIQYITKRTEKSLAEVELTKCQVNSPFDGYVEERYAQLGQWLQAGTPVFKIMQMDRLRVEGSYNSRDYPGMLKIGTPVRMTLRTSANDTTELAGTVGYISMEQDTLGLRRFWVEIENREVDGDYLFKPGMKASVEVTQ